MNVWHDCGVVTSLALACDEIMQEKDSPAIGVELWNQDVDDLYENTKGIFKLYSMITKFNQIYTHPVKLSRWK